MADAEIPLMGHNANGLSDEAVRQTMHYKVSAIQSLFGGRFSQEELQTLLISFEEDLFETSSFLLRSEPGVIREKLEREQQSWTIVGQLRQLKRDHRRVTIAANGTIHAEVRQFACQPCDQPWWKRVPANKQVSKCPVCRQKFEALPRDKEWGIGVFSCPGCNSQFHGWIQMGHYSTCNRCKMHVFPSRILPPNERSNEPRRRQNVHSCECCEAGNGICAHPQARRREGFRVLHPSNVHASSGSTVNTFLPQEDLLNPIEDVYDRISQIPEENEDEED